MGDRLSELVNTQDYGKFLDEILALDPKIIHVAIYDGRYHAKFKNETSGFFKEEEIKTSFSHAKNQWTCRKNIGCKIGEPRFTMSQYGKINRITFPISKECVIVVTTELHLDVNKFVDNIVDVRRAFEFSLPGFFYR